MTKFDPHAEYGELSTRLNWQAAGLNRSARERKAAVLMREAAKGIDDLLAGLAIVSHPVAGVLKKRRLNCQPEVQITVQLRVIKDGQHRWQGQNIGLQPGGVSPSATTRHSL